MYLFTYAYDDKNANELFAGILDIIKNFRLFFLNIEYHLGRKAFRICKRNTRFCSWHNEMPELFVYR